MGQIGFSTKYTLYMTEYSIVFNFGPFQLKYVVDFNLALSSL